MGFLAAGCVFQNEKSIVEFNHTIKHFPLFMCLVFGFLVESKQTKYKISISIFAPRENKRCLFAKLL